MTRLIVMKHKIFKNEIPKRWEVVRLRDIIKESINGDWGKEKAESNHILAYVIRGTDFPQILNGDYFNLPERFIDVKKLTKISLNEGDLIVEISGGSKDQPTGRIAIIKNYNQVKPLVFTNFIKKILIRDEKADNYFLFYFWTFLYNSGIIKLYENRTTNIRNFRFKDFIKNTKIPLPPLPEQRRIAEILSTVDDAIQKVDAAISKTERLKKGLLHELLTKGIGHKEFKDTEIGRIPKEWEVVRLGDKKIARIIMGQSPPSSTYNQEGKGMPFLQGKTEFGEIYPSPTMFCSSPIKVAESNDVLISVRAPVGEVNIAPFKCCIGRGLAAIRPNGDSLYFLYLFYLLKIQAKRLESISSGSTFKAIKKEDIEKFKIPLPPLPEQRRIAEILSTVDQKLDLLKKRKEKLIRIKKGLMNDLLTGKRRVKLNA